MLDIGSAKGTGLSCFPQISVAASINMPSRDRFYVELKPGETTFVSWKKLLKESQKTAESSSPHAEPPVGAHPALEARIAPEVVKDPLPPSSNRFSSVIEKIERLYQGGNSDDELCDEVIDDDKYDTRDSFIDDTELDDYFSVENTRLKHSGFFVNKGKLEKEVEPASPLLGPKKRKRKDLKKLISNSNEVVAKQLKSAVRLKAAARGGPSPSSLSSLMKTHISGQKKKKNFHSPGLEMGRTKAVTAVELELNNARANETFISRDISGSKAEGKQSLEGLVEDRMMVDNIEGSLNAKERSVGLIDINEPVEKSALVTFEPGDPFSTNGLKTKSVERCIKDNDAKESLLIAKRFSLAGKEMSPARNKGTALEKALLDLEKDVSELYPLSSGMKEPEHGRRNRLPRDLKLKLAKVARLAAKQGRITDDMIERLMGIFGHVIRERTLKRHLKSMTEMGVSAMQEKEGRLQGIKKEVSEMIKSRLICLQSQDSHLANEMGGSSEKASGEGWYQWDHETEDKICDLYEQYTQGMNDNKGPHLRKFYTELAELWPNGSMDNSGIKLAVHRSKERKKKLNKATSSSDTKIRRRKPKVEDSGGDGLTLLQLFTSGERTSDPNSTEKLRNQSHDVELILYEKKKIFNKNGANAEVKSRILDEPLFMKKKMRKEVEQGINFGQSISFPLDVDSSVVHDSFHFPLSSSLPSYDPPFQNSVGTTNGAHISPH